MYEIRLHGLGGEGVVKLSEMIGKAATASGRWAHSFPFFGTEVRGASVKAFTRVDDKPITIKSYIYEPDVLIITNELQLQDQSILSGLKDDSWLIVNTAMEQEEFAKDFGCHVIAVNATAIGYEIIGKPIVNTILLGVLIGATNIISLESAIEVLKHEFNEKLSSVNIEAMKKGYEEGKKVTQ